MVSVPSRICPFRRIVAPRPVVRGFVLVSVLLIIALATVLVVVASMMAQLERTAASNAVKVEQARLQALFALDVALNQLQAAAGPDQRVTARAEILDSNPGTPNIDNVNQPYWTGVWRTGTNHLDVGGDPQRQLSFRAGSADATVAEKAGSAVWLVSATNAANPTIFDGVTNGVARDAVAMASNYGTSSNHTNVVVPLTVTTTSGATNGAYAYWISDEGLKAKVNLTARTLGASSAGERQLHTVVPQALHQGKGLLGTNNAADLRDPGLAGSLAKTTTLSSFRFVPGISAGPITGRSANRLLADATTVSMGVLADVRRGGLKKDLTAAFEDPGNTPGRNYAKLNPNGTALVYRALTDAYTTASLPTAATSAGFDGLKWLSLYSFYNFYKGTFPSLNLGGRIQNPYGSPPRGVGDPEISLPYGVSPRGIGWTDSALGTQATQVSYGTLAPTFLGYRWDTSVSARPVGPAFQLQIHYYFQIILHNPYSVAIQANLNNFRYGRALAAASDKYLETRVLTGNQTMYYYTAINQGATLQRQVFSTSFDDTQVLAPGETRVFGLTASQDGLTVKQACEYRDDAPPYGFASRGYAPTFRRTARLQRITARTSSNGSRTPQNDSYADVPDVPSGSTVRLRITADPSDAAVSNPAAVTDSSAPTSTYTISGSGSADVSIPQASMWVTDGGSGGSTLQAVSGRAGSNGRRVFQSGAPGSVSTGQSGSVTRAPFGPIAVESLSETQVLSMFSRKKGVIPTPTTTPPRYTNTGFVVPYFAGNSAQFNLFYDTNARYWDELFVSGNNAWPSYPPSSSELQLDLDAEGFTLTSWGDASTGVDAPGRRIVLADIPIQPLVSIGQLMHVKPFYMFSTGNFTSVGFGSMFIGGSYPSAEVPLDVTALTTGTASGAATLNLDHSFLANQVLFDSFFFSTVPPAGAAPSGTTWPQRWTNFNARNPGASLSDRTTPLLNERMTPYFRDSQPPLMADLRDMDRAAANLLLDGAFNVNSTSEEAWVALLSSLSGNAISFWDASDRAAATLSSLTLRNPVVRFFAANTSSEVNERWSGIRALDDGQVRALAREIVTQVKTRGPFLSMADFLNRRLGTASTQLTRSGALQNAIDRTDLNDAVKTGVAVTLSAQQAAAPQNSNPIPGNMRDASSDAGAAWDSTVGAPGYLMQQDLVQNFSAVMAVRSDTFAVRVYGEVRRPNGTDVLGRAWGEAIVQRVPDFVDQTDTALGAPPDQSIAISDSNGNPTLNATNRALGRRFKVVSFRWLNSNEI
ncbi:MAG: hypothetical protein SFU53_15550 [Terrimicrobiaceae bacterium]|nr:hypothetical protein [Terrimicrobiaceae bacterium]